MSQTVSEISLKIDHTKTSADERIMYFDILLDDSEIGYIYYVGNERSIKDIGNIGYFVKEEFRGHNYAYKACLKLFDILKAKKINRIYAYVLKDNQASLSIMKKLGLTIVDEQLDHYLFMTNL